MTKWLPPLLALLTAPFLPAWLARQGVGGVAEGEALGEAVAAWTHAELSAEGFSTGAALFDGEWWFGTYTMAALGFGQLALAHPERAERWLAEMDHALTQATQGPVRRFDAERWGEDPLAPALEGDHVAYLGYLALPLALRASLSDDPPAEHSLQVFTALEARFQARQAGLLETYPGEGYPVDNCMALGAWGLWAQAQGQETPAWLEDWTARLLAEQVDPQTGLLIQHAEPTTGAPRSPPRGSGTALCAYALSFAWPERGRALAEATRAELADTFLGFGVVREYPRGVEGRGDIDSGPVILGYSVSATGFAIADARLLGDAAWEARLLSTARLYGVPLGGQYVTGGPLGNALLLAMSTTPMAR